MKLLFDENEALIRGHSVGIHDMVSSGKYATIELSE